MIHQEKESRILWLDLPIALIGFQVVPVLWPSVNQRLREHPCLSEVPSMSARSRVHRAWMCTRLRYTAAAESLRVKKKIAHWEHFQKMVQMWWSFLDSTGIVTSKFKTKCPLKFFVGNTTPSDLISECLMDRLRRTCLNPRENKQRTYWKKLSAICIRGMQTYTS